MLKVKLRMTCTRVGVPDSECEYYYDGTEEEFDKDPDVANAILNQLYAGFGDFYLDTETEEVEDPEDWNEIDDENLLV